MNILRFRKSLSTLIATKSCSKVHPYFRTSEMLGKIQRFCAILIIFFNSIAVLKIIILILERELAVSRKHYLLHEAGATGSTGIIDSDIADEGCAGDVSRAGLCSNKIMIRSCYDW